MAASRPQRLARPAARHGLDWARVWLGFGLLAALLFSRLAVAAYACPAQAAAAQMPAAMPCAEMVAAALPLDGQQPLLCQQHCQWGHTEQAGAGQALAAVAMAPAPLWVVLPAAAPALGLPATGAALAPPQERPPPAPLRTLLCCLRA